jgi:branched-chain amino acid transport system substrate-binding protein
MDTQVVCLNWCTDELFISLAGDSAEGVVGSAPFAFAGSGAAGLEDLLAYNEGTDPSEISIRYVQGWMTMHVMSEAVEMVIESGDEVTGPNIRAALETMSGFDTGGVTPPLTFTGDDHGGSDAMVVVQAEGGAWVAITDYLEAGG